NLQPLVFCLNYCYNIKLKDFFVSFPKTGPIIMGAYWFRQG
ncbi:hypothetical protein ALO_01689, partial [Acetonema longum DSM 6540]